jgi:hypothetical protein
MSGIRTLDDLLDRCVVDKITECWVYRVQPHPLAKRKHPTQVWMADLKTLYSPARAAWLLSGRPKGQSKDWTVWRTCETQYCCNPTHSLAGTRKAMGKWVKKTGHWRGNPRRSAVNRLVQIASGRSVINHEIADAIRKSDKKGVELAKELGVHPSVISNVRTGKTWNTVSNASVFVWKGSK